MTKVIKKQIEIKKHKFTLEVYPYLEGTKEVTWEIFPIDYKAALYAFSNKDKLNKKVETEYL